MTIVSWMIIPFGILTLFLWMTNGFTFFLEGLFRVSVLLFFFIPNLILKPYNRLKSEAFKNKSNKEQQEIYFKTIKPYLKEIIYNSGKLNKRPKNKTVNSFISYLYTETNFITNLVENKQSPSSFKNHQELNYYFSQKNIVDAMCNHYEERLEFKNISFDRCLYITGNYYPFYFKSPQFEKDWSDFEFQQWVTSKGKKANAF